LGRQKEKKVPTRFYIVSWWVFVLTLSLGTQACAQAVQLEKIKLPPGFEISVYASNVENARSMALSPNGILFVGSRRVGNVYAIVDRDKDQKADEVITIAEDLTVPNGVAFKDGSLYVAEINRVLRFDDIESRLEAPPTPVVVNDQLPTVRTGGCTCRWGLRAISASRMKIGMRTLCEWRRTAAGWRRSLAGFATRSVSTGIRRPRSFGLRITGAIGWARISRRMN
jgi:hypothetical protein